MIPLRSGIKSKSFVSYARPSMIRHLPVSPALLSPCSRLSHTYFHLQEHGGLLRKWTVFPPCLSLSFSGAVFHVAPSSWSSCPSPRSSGTTLAHSQCSLPRPPQIFPGLLLEWTVFLLHTLCPLYNSNIATVTHCCTTLSPYQTVMPYSSSRSQHLAVLGTVGTRRDLVDV